MIYFALVHDHSALLAGRNEGTCSMWQEAILFIAMYNTFVVACITYWLSIHACITENAAFIQRENSRTAGERAATGQRN